MAPPSALQQLQKIIDGLEEAKADADKFDGGNAAAGTRIRSAALTAKKGLDALRQSVQAEKNARKG